MSDARAEFLESLARYGKRIAGKGVPAYLQPGLAEQWDIYCRFGELMKDPTCADRDTYPGHLTGSALVVSPSRDRVLLTHHRKLGRWLQLGGHADGSFDLPAAALREAEEESGLADLAFYPLEVGFPQAILDLDVHWIPEGKEPGHYHYDVRYLIVAEPSREPQVSEESLDVKWLALEEAYRVTFGSSMHRLLDKIPRNAL